MKEFKSINGIKDEILKLIIQDDVEMCLTSSTDDYVVFDGTAEILFEGTFPECYVYSKEFRKYRGFDVTIYSREAYEEMMQNIKKQL